MKKQIIAQIPDSEQDSEGGTSRTSTDRVELVKKASFSEFFTNMCRCLHWRRPKKYNHFTTKSPLIVPNQSGRNIGKKTLVLDLDETLVHSSFSPIPSPDLQFNLHLEGQLYTVFVRVRPGAFEFIRMLAQDYEIMIYTASISEYADPVIDYIDPQGCVSVRLFRENCTLFKNVFVKDLSNLNRDIKKIIIVDNSPNSFMFQPMNAFQIKNFFDDMADQELYYLIPFFKLLKEFNDVRPVHEWWYKFVNFEQFHFTNTRGQRVVYQLKEEDLEEGDSVGYNLPGSGQPAIQSNLETPKSEHAKLVVPNPLKKQQKSQTQANKNKEFLVELEEKLGLTTEGNEPVGKQEMEEEDSQMRQELNINSPKESLNKTMNFPQGPQQEQPSQEY